MEGTASRRPDDEQGRDGRWPLVLGLLVVVRLAIPLLTLAFSGHALPGLPPYRYQPLNGDSFGFYAAAREFIASIGRVSKPLLLLATLVVVGAIVIAVRLWRPVARRTDGSPSSCRPRRSRSLSTLPIHRMHPPGAAVFGWPLLWSIPMIPIRVVGLDPTPDTAFVIGLALTLAALGVAVVATAYVGPLRDGPPVGRA